MPLIDWIFNHYEGWLAFGFVLWILMNLSPFLDFLAQKKKSTHVITKEEMEKAKARLDEEMMNAETDISTCPELDIRLDLVKKKGRRMPVEILKFILTLLAGPVAAVVFIVALLFQLVEHQPVEEEED